MSDAMSRRQFTRLLSLAAAGAGPLAHFGTGAAGAAGAPSGARLSALEGDGLRARPPVGLQLYTVRALMQKDVPGTLATLAELGVQEVEFAGYFDVAPAALGAMLQRLGLRSPAAHVGLPNDWEPVFDAAEALGHRWVVVPWVGAEVRESADSWRRFADRLNQAGRLAQGRPVRVGYHNHDFEFTRFGDQMAFDILLEALDPTLVDVELDLYWAVHAGQDPAALIARYPGRFPLWHVKDAGPAPERKMVDVGAGTIDFSALFAKGAQAGLQHAFIEHDNPADPLASVQRSVRALQRME